MALSRIGKYATAKLKRAWQAALFYDRKRRKDIIFQRYLNTDLGALVDPTFDTACAVNWTCGTGWTIGTGVASSDGTQIDTSDLEATATGLTDGVTYRVVFEVTAYTAGNVNIRLGTASGTNRAATGTFEENITANTPTTVSIRADANFVGSVDNIAIYPTE